MAINAMNAGAVISLLYPVLATHHLVHLPKHIIAISYEFDGPEEQDYVVLHEDSDAINFVNGQLEPDIRIMHRHAWKARIKALTWPVFRERWLRFGLGEDRLDEIVSYILEESEA
jgi:hypothetical protein